jgi:hypothetical protein
MLRRLLAVSIIVVSVAACGGNSPTESPSAAPESPATSAAPATSPSATPEASPAPTAFAATTKHAACTSVAIRAAPSLTGKVLAKVSLGVKVRVVDVITGDSYTTGICGSSGDTWLKITKVQGKKTQKLYGVPFAYAAAGLFE